MCSPAASAVRLRRGSTTTMRPPRARIASSRPGQSGAVANDPFDSYGFAPSINEVVGAVEIGHRRTRLDRRT